MLLFPVKLSELQDALETFQQAHDLAKILEDEAAETAISKAIRDVNDRIAQGTVHASPSLQLSISLFMTNYQCT